MTLSHRIQLDPTAKQRKYFARACGTARLTWNWALAEWDEQYRAGGKPKATELRRYFNTIKYAKWPWMKGIHRDAHSQPFANLQSAFTKFYKGTAKRPRFKKKGKSRDSMYVANDKVKVVGWRVALPIIGMVRMTEELRFSGKIQSATVSRDADRWFISFSVDMPDPTPVPPAGEPVGIDMGLTTFAALSTGEHVKAPKPLAASIRRLRRLSRRHSRKVQGSNNRRKAGMRLARHHRRVRNIRQDFIHKFTTKVASSHSEVCMEDLNVSGMVKNHNLARAINDVGWGETRRQFSYKCPKLGSKLTVRDRFLASSKLCSECGHKNTALKLSERTWTCEKCSTVHDRDGNASANILNDGVPRATREFQACGDCGADGGATRRETAVDEAGTTTVRTHLRSHRR